MVFAPNPKNVAAMCLELAMYLIIVMIFMISKTTRQNPIFPGFLTKI